MQDAYVPANWQEWILFEEGNKLYLVFYVIISILKILSSFFYMGMITNIYVKWYEIRNVQIQMLVYESCFLMEMILQFFRKVTPDGYSHELNNFVDIAIHYFQTMFLWHAIPLIPF